MAFLKYSIKRTALFKNKEKIEKWYKQTEASNKEYNISSYRKSDEVLLIRSGSVVLDLPNKKSVEDEDIIFIKDRKEIPKLVLIEKVKKHKRLLSTREEKEKKKPRITTLSLSKKKDEDKNKNSSDFKDKQRLRLKKVVPKAVCNICKLKLKLSE